MGYCTVCPHTPHTSIVQGAAIIHRPTKGWSLYGIRPWTLQHPINFFFWCVVLGVYLHIPFPMANPSTKQIQPGPTLSPAVNIVTSMIQEDQHMRWCTTTKLTAPASEWSCRPICPCVPMPIFTPDPIDLTVQGLLHICFPWQRVVCHVATVPYFGDENGAGVEEMYPPPPCASTAAVPEVQAKQRFNATPWTNPCLCATHTTAKE